MISEETGIGPLKEWVHGPKQTASSAKAARCLHIVVEVYQRHLSSWAAYQSIDVAYFVSFPNPVLFFVKVTFTRGSRSIPGTNSSVYVSFLISNCRLKGQALYDVAVLARGPYTHIGGVKGLRLWYFIPTHNSIFLQPIFLVNSYCYTLEALLPVHQNFKNMNHSSHLLVSTMENDVLSLVNTPSGASLLPNLEFLRSIAK